MSSASTSGASASAATDQVPADTAHHWRCDGGDDITEFRTWLDGIDTFLLDCDGVLWLGTEGIPGVANTVAQMKRLGKRVFFVSNNSTKSRGDFVHKLSAVSGIASTEREIISSAYAAAMWCAENGLSGGKAYCVGMEGLQEELRRVGLDILGPADAHAPFAFGTLDHRVLDQDVRVVVAGFDGQLSYTKIAMACSYLRYGKDVKFVATNRDLTYPDKHMLVPGGGVVIAAIEAGSGRRPDVVAGKPSGDILTILEKAEGLRRGHACMVGDRLDTDILFGARGGLASRLLVLTGVSKVGDYASLPADDPHRPTHVTASFAVIGKLIEAAYPV